MKTKPFNLKEAIQHPERIVDLSRGAYAALDISVDASNEQYPIVITWSDGCGTLYTLDGREDSTDAEPAIALRTEGTELNQKLITFDLELAKTGMYEIRTRDGSPISEWHHFSEVAAGNNPVVYVTRDGHLHTVSEDGLWRAPHNTHLDLMLVQDTIRIGDVDVPAPLRKAPEENTPVWIPDKGPSGARWYDGDWYRSMLASRRVFRTEEDCQAFIDALAKL